MALEAQNNPFTSVLMVEAADPEAIGDADPASGQRRLVVGADHLLYLLDDSGVATLVGGSGGDITTDTAWAAKGDLIVGSANDTAVIKTVGANDTILMADSSATGGVKWVASQTPSTQAFSDAAAEGTADTYARGDHKHAMPASPGGGGSLVWLQRQAASSSASLDFTGFISSTYTVYLFDMMNVLPATNAQELRMQVGTGGGPTYDTGSNYASLAFRWTTAASAAGGSTGQTYIGVDGGAGVDMPSNTAADGGVNGFVKLYNPSNASAKKAIVGEAHNPSQNGIRGGVFNGAYLSNTAVTAVRFLFGSGNIASGEINVYGLTHA